MNSHSGSASTNETIFSYLDRDRDGTINENDLQALMEQLGQSPTPEQLKRITNSAKLTPQQPWTFSEFFASSQPNCDRNRLWHAFLRFDRDGDGAINACDLAVTLTQFGESVSIEDATELIQQWVDDTELEPHLDYETFVRVMLAKPIARSPVHRFDSSDSNPANLILSVRGENLQRDIDPASSHSELSDSDYVRSLQLQALEHEAINHTYLQRLAQGQFPDIHGALKDFARQYHAYSQSFRAYLQATMAHLSQSQSAQLQDNLAEELGHFDRDREQELESLGIDPAWVRGIPHPDLFRRFQEALGLQVSDSMAPMAEPYCAEAIAFEQEIQELCDRSAAIAIGALGLGTELVVQPMYRYLLQATQSHTSLTPQEYVFFSLHAEIDDDHAEILLNIAIELAATPQGRRQLAEGMESALNARSRFWHALLARALNLPKTISNSSSESSHIWELNQDGATAENLYNAQSQRWVRREPSCLSDFTARPEVFKLCAPVGGLRVLDLGCGEGYCSRALKRQGAAELIGVDVSENMIGAARAEEERDRLGIRYLQGDATDIISILHQHQAIGDGELVHGAFDLIICVFLFNYVTLDEMEACLQQIHQLLRPGGRFVFSVPHPSFAFWDREPKPPFYFQRQSPSISRGDKPADADNGSSATGYFTSKDRLLPGIICHKDGTELNVQVRHKSLQDYFDRLQWCGFSTMPVVKELHVTEELLASDRDYFAPLLNVPLHLAFSVEKARPSIPTMIPQAKPDILWSRLFSLQDYQIQIPAPVLAEFQTVLDHLRPRGITWENYQFGDGGSLPHIAVLGLQIRQRLQETSGVALLQGIDLGSWGNSFAEQEAAAKLFYLLLAQAVGTVLTKRGRLYDVLDRNLDVAEDNVLFSATNAASGWHTDSTDKDFFPDWVGLMSLRPSLDGGRLQVTNALNVYHRLRSLLPSWIFRYLEVPILRDLIETGFGAQSGDLWERVRRHPDVNLQGERIRQNTFPIFARDPLTGRFSFRYMRYWIESGHQRAEVPLSPLLAIAMNALDRVLSVDPEIARIEHTLQPGEIIFLNNHICPHHRTAFQDNPTHPRKMVRVWLQSEEK